MLKVKKIMESVIPKTVVISEEEKIVVKTLADDGAHTMPRHFIACDAEKTLN